MISPVNSHRFPAWLLIISCICTLSNSHPAYSEENENDQLAVNTLIKGNQVIKITRQQQKTSGLASQVLQAAKYHSDFIAYGEAIDLLPLLKLRNRYFQALADYKIAQSKHQLAQESYLRVRNLHRNDATSKRKLHIQESQWEEAQARQEAMAYEIKSIQELALLDWSPPLSEWLFAPDSEEFTRLISGQQTLLQVTLPPNRKLPSTATEIMVARSGLRSQAVKARFLSSAREANEDFQGESFFFITSKKIQTGIHVTAWIAHEENELAGVVIPFSAVVRHLGQSYVYLQTGETQFSRQAISTLLQTSDGYFLENGIRPGDKLVTHGAQMLLSEEFRGQIPDEDDD